MKKASNYPIDAVITWVDGSDPKWQKSKAKYAKKYLSPESTNAARFRDWDNLDLVVQSIKQNLPWIRQIFIVTAGQTPKWYDGKDSKVKLVFHQDFIPKKYLPTFNANTIELNLHRIQSLAEHFISFNDDMFVINPMRPTDFFKNGLPCDFGLLHIHCQKQSLMIYDICNNNVSLINEHFDIKNIKKSHYLNPRYGFKNNLKNLFLLECPRFPGFFNIHLPQPLLKSTCQAVWQTAPDTLDQTCQHKFRTKDDVNHWVIKDWQICTGNFVPISPKNRGALIDFEKNSPKTELAKAVKIIRGHRAKLLCVNDGDTIQDYQTIKQTINTALRQKLTKKER